MGGSSGLGSSGFRWEGRIVPDDPSKPNQDPHLSHHYSTRKQTFPTLRLIFNLDLFLWHSALDPYQCLGRKLVCRGA